MQNIRTMQIFNFYGLCRIGYRYIDYFLIRIRDGKIPAPSIPIPIPIPLTVARF